MKFMTVVLGLSCLAVAALNQANVFPFNKGGDLMFVASIMASINLIAPRIPKLNNYTSETSPVWVIYSYYALIAISTIGITIAVLGSGIYQGNMEWNNNTKIGLIVLTISFSLVVLLIEVTRPRK